jgi:hypothetical protein
LLDSGEKNEAYRGCRCGCSGLVHDERQDDDNDAHGGELSSAVTMAESGEGYALEVFW